MLLRVLIVIMALAPSAWANAAQTVAVFPFELLDQSQEGEIILKVRPDETKRLALLTNDLKTRLAQSNVYVLADLTSLEADIKSASPLHKCNGCETDLAKKAKAQFALMGLVQKVSDTLLNVSIQLVEAETGVVAKSYSASVQGNTDEAWLRGISYIVRNRLLVQGASQ